MQQFPVKSDGFVPPTAGQVAGYLDSHPARLPSRWMMWMPLIGVGFVIALAASIGGGVAQVLPWLVMFALLGYLGYKGRRVRFLDKRVADAHELAMLRMMPASLRLTWRLLPQLVTLPNLYGRALSLLALSLHILGSHEAALVAYDRVISGIPSESPMAFQLRLQRCLAWLANDQITPAEDELRRLQNQSTDIQTPPAIIAALRYTRLYQQVRTYHFADAVEMEHDLLATLAPLGIDAGYGYALMAHSFLHVKVSEPENPAKLLASAKEWWRLATMLIPPGDLAQRVPELREAADTLPATHWPL
ncbi:MAG: hypothetical protein GC164_00695 [Phycisphaera sp.]|nr:hypothetical protein [Phycisphaera sp.]